jgi:hypothetical protein
LGGFDDDFEIQIENPEFNVMETITNQRASKQLNLSTFENNDLTQYVQTYEDFCKQHLVRNSKELKFLRKDISKV